jgi:hypothetical protein
MYILQSCTYIVREHDQNGETHIIQVLIQF